MQPVRDPTTLDESMSAKSPAYRTRLYRCTFLYEDGRREVRHFACASDRGAFDRTIAKRGELFRERGTGLVEMVGPYLVDDHGGYVEPGAAADEAQWLTTAWREFLTGCGELEQMAGRPRVELRVIQGGRATL